MTKKIKADAKTIELKTNGLIPLLYKKEFGKDFFDEIKEISNRNFDMEVMYNLVWIFAYTADNTIPQRDEWLAGFEAFPITEYVSTVIDLATACVVSKKKTKETSKKKTAATAQ